MKEVAADLRVFVVQVPMWRWEMKQEDNHGTGDIREETKLMTSLPTLDEVLRGECFNFKGKAWHRHLNLAGVKRAAAVTA